jgi:hypothetical protein
MRMLPSSFSENLLDPSERRVGGHVVSTMPSVVRRAVHTEEGAGTDPDPFSG